MKAQLPRLGLQLDRAIVIPDGRTRRFLQGGALVGRIDHFNPHCALEIRHLHGPPRTVPAGVYPVIRVEPVLTEVVWAAPAARLAALDVQQRLVAYRRTDADLPTEVFAGHHYWLQDVAGIGLLRMTCFGERAMPTEARPPGPAEVAAALGSFGHLIERNQATHL